MCGTRSSSVQETGRAIGVLTLMMNGTGKMSLSFWVGKHTAENMTIRGTGALNWCVFVCSPQLHGTFAEVSVHRAPEESWMEGGHTLLVLRAYVTVNTDSTSLGLRSSPVRW